MFLKSVELFGFKSFADRSKIEFQDGISALLGPNGCGKSNVVDCIKWVLGEQSTKTLRAEKMEDIIFNGTENRKPLNVAEVTLSISNDEGLLPIELPELSIKRRLYRSGESEYYLNNTPVKLKELRELFFDTGIGKTSYSIMEQGKIDQILSSKPEERRYMFEEAAGITRYKIKGAEAERKLVKTEENMNQVSSIIHEVKRSYETLKIQSEKTGKYRELKDRIFDYELNIQLLRLKSFLEENDKQKKRLEEMTADKVKVKAEIDTLNENLEENLDLVNTMESKLIEDQKKLYGIDLEKSGSENQIVLLGEREGELNKQIESGIVRDRALDLRIGSLLEQIGNKEKDLAEFAERLKEFEENEAAFKENTENAVNRKKANQNEIIQKENEIKELDNAGEEFQVELHKLTDDIVTELDIKLKETGYSYQERANTEAEIFKTLESITIHLDGRMNILNDALRAGKTAGPEMKKIIESAVATLEDSVSGVESLRGLFDLYKKAVPSFIDAFLAPEGIITKKRNIDDKIEELKRGITARKERTAEIRIENAALEKKIEEYRKTLEELRINKTRMKTRQDAVRESINQLQRELSEQKNLKAENLKENDAARNKLSEISEKRKLIEKEKTRLEKEEKELKKELAKLENGISKNNRNVSSKEKKLKDKMAVLGKVQNRIEQIHIDLAATKTEIRNIYDNFRDKHSRDLTEFESGMYEINQPAADLRKILADLKEEQKKLGHVNLMAPEEFAEVKERYEFLNEQFNDLSSAKEDLKNITKQIKIESTELFLETYDKIKKNFHILFRRLFGGGRAELKLVDPANVLTSGIEIYAQPPGKKLENIALLSGGERSLTAVGMLFATYMVKPSPFCVLDEIDAALDEANIGRFINLLMEFGEKSQFIIITHNKKTVACAKTLLGVTMEESGVSKTIAVRLEGPGREEKELVGDSLV